MIIASRYNSVHNTVSWAQARGHQARNRDEKQASLSITPHGRGFAQFPIGRSHQARILGFRSRKASIGTQNNPNTASEKLSLSPRAPPGTGVILTWMKPAYTQVYKNENRGL